MCGRGKVQCLWTPLWKVFGATLLVHFAASYLYVNRPERSDLIESYIQESLQLLNMEL